MTDYKTAKEEILGTYSLEDLQDIVNHGCASGCAEKHITFNQTVEFFDKYKEEINEYILQTINDGEFFVAETKENSEGDIKKFKNDLAWTFIELIAMEITDDVVDDEEEEGITHPLDFQELFTTCYKDRYLEDNDATYYMLVNISAYLEGSDDIEDSLNFVFNTPNEKFKEEILDSYWSKEDFNDFGFDGEFTDDKELVDQVEWVKVWESIQYSCNEEILKKEIAHDQEIEIAEVKFKKLFCNNSKGGQK
tara:strand:- start:15 stop:764 length:750 start_codon:yes stop_codon:yes gene_type:complete